MFTVTTRNQAIFWMTFGYVLAITVFTALAYLLLMPFGYGYLGAELCTGYLLWSTAYRWDHINEQFAARLEAGGF